MEDRRGLRNCLQEGLGRLLISLLWQGAETMAGDRALSEVFAQDRQLARPVPDIGKLRSAVAISTMPDFRSWGD